MREELGLRIAAHEKKRLAEAAERRFSCRRYSGELTLADWSALSYLSGKCAAPGVHLLLTGVGDDVFTGIPVVGKITGCRAVAMVSCRTDPESRVLAGFSGEHFVLSLEALGFHTCWVTGTYRKNALPAIIPAGDTLMGIIAFGPSQERQPPRRRKGLDRLCSGRSGAWPEECLRAAELVLAAPSAMNLQPVHMSLPGSELSLDAPPRSAIDLGIALAHAELAITAPHRWLIGSDIRDLTARCVWTE